MRIFAIVIAMFATEVVYKHALQQDYHRLCRRELVKIGLSVTLLNL